MTVKSNLYSIFYKNGNQTWSGPWQGVVFKAHEKDYWKEEAKGVLRKEIKVMQQVWEEN
tara:strand:+ start:331 stop:507 length:177 start_codon:yes stop_codon:yes gene_type:complete